MNSPFDKHSFKGKVVLITGGTMGIGQGCCEAFCSAGATVVICARNAERGERLAAEMNAGTTGHCTFVACDVTDPDQIKRMIDEVVATHGRLDCLVNNAGWHPPDLRIDDFSVQDFQQLLQLNLVSIFAACKFALPHLRKTKGSIINMASLVGSIGQANACTYVATKSGIIGLTKALAVDEAEHGVRVNSVSPAAIVTPLAESVVNAAPDPKREYAWIESWHHLGRYGTIQEVGQVCLFLASEAASFLTGVDIPVSGGAELAYGCKFKSMFRPPYEAGGETAR